MCSLDALAGDFCRVQALGCAVAGGRHPSGLAKFLPNHGKLRWFVAVRSLRFVVRFFVRQNSKFSN